MSNAIVVPDSFNAPVAAAFQGVQAADDLSGGITGGYGLLKFRGKVWSIQYQGNVQNLMREDGDGPRGSVDLIIVKANPTLSKTWYENGWDESNNAPPDCASAGGIFPDAGVPKKQSDTCAMCPRNAWGSAPNGGKGKACGDHRRMAVVPMADPKNEYFGGPLLLRCPAASLQDLAAFNSRYHQLGYPYFAMAIKIGFDPQESYPKFTFAAIRPLTEQEAQVVIALRDDPATARVVNETVAGAAPAQVAQPQATFLQAPPPNAVQPQQQVPNAQPAPGPATVVAAPAATAATAATGGVPPIGGGGGNTVTGFGPVSAPSNGAGVAPAQAAPAPAPAQATQPVSAGGFGPVASAVPAQAAPQQAQQPAQRRGPAMTGFGPATTETAPAAAPAGPAAAPAGPAAAPAVTPGVVTAFEGSIDDRLNALING